jgi:hypothetical protein
VTDDLFDVAMTRRQCILQAYHTALGNYGDDTLGGADLFYEVRRFLPDVTAPELMEALRWDAERCLREVAALEGYLTARRCEEERA